MSAQAYVDVAPQPALALVSSLTSLLAEAREVPVELLSTREKADTLEALSKAGDLLAALRLRVLAISDDVAQEHGARDVGAWLADRTRTDPGPRHRDRKLGEALSYRWTKVGTALGDGRLNEAQAQVIVQALDALPAGVEPAVLADAEERLVGFGAEFAPRQLRVLGRRILDVVAPEVGEEHEARALAAEEERALARTSLNVHRVGDGFSRIIAVVPDAVAHRLTTYLEAFTSPRHDAMAGGPLLSAAGDRLPAEQARGLAFCSLLETLDPKRLPLHGGDATTVVVTVTLDALRADLATAGLLGADEPITASAARRLACTAGVIPVVLGGDSEILDLGRTARLHSKAQRKALRIRDKRCRAEGCSVPATWCEAHHRRPWLLGGRTNLADGVLLCSFHHHRAHDSRYVQTDLSSGDIRFSRRT